MLSKQAAKIANSLVRPRLSQTLNNTSALNVEWVNSSTDSQTMSEIYKLRYKVMCKDVRVNPFPEDHYCIKGDEFRDDLDLMDTTAHCLIRFNGKPVASTRIVDGRNGNQLEAEYYKWVDVRKGIEPYVNDVDNIAEPCRVVADRCIRGTGVVPLMYLHCLDWFMKENIENFVGMCNSEAKPLVEHYSKWAQCNWIGKEPFPVDDFIPGRKLHYCTVNVGVEGSPERDKFMVGNYLPAFAAYSMMKSPTEKKIG